MNSFEFSTAFVSRHIGPRESDIKKMLDIIGIDSLESLIDETIPDNIRINKELDLPEALTEFQYLNKIKKIAAKNKVYKSYIGMGYYNTILPPVIRRNILENPGWYTQYTPYQAEISQGRLEALVNFQTMIIDLTKMDIANASLLDEATAAAEAMIMLFNMRKNVKSDTFFISEECLPQTIEVLKTRSEPLGIKLFIGNHQTADLNQNLFGLLLQYPAAYGQIYNYKDLINKAKLIGIHSVIAADLMSLLLLTPPGEFGADVVVGSTQRFGIPVGYGGPHAAFFAAKEEFKRFLPGRIIGASIDVHGNKAYRMALQTREQHIRREKATSNICTSQVLLAIMAGMYAVYHGPDGLRSIALHIHMLTSLLNFYLEKLSFNQVNDFFFDTLKIKLDHRNELDIIKSLALESGINFNYLDERTFGISIDETTDVRDINTILEVLFKVRNESFNLKEDDLSVVKDNLPPDLKRTSTFLQEKVFNRYHSETEMMRYLKNLEKKDLSLTGSMIPLGSCTMKLNAASEMFGMLFDEFSSIHPFVPFDQVIGYKEIIEDLESWLARITGFDAVSLQPNSGAQGEYTGLLVIRKYHNENKNPERNVVLIPSSAHGTNPASAVMAGMKVVVVNCDLNGNVDINDLKLKAEINSENLAGLMITYPSTHGVFEESVKEICSIIHSNGGLVYMDGANLNAQIGYTNPGFIGADVCHINLHKTFAIPHGGGGPGMGPIAVNKKLIPFLPGHPIIKVGGEKAITPVSAAPFGSANILTISHAYIALMGSQGLKKATEIAILNANYIKSRLEDSYKPLYKGKKGRVAHELIFDVREFKSSANVDVEDIAKRLMDYGFHAPTVSFPVPGTLMVEPTESESKEELDRFCNAMILIKEEIRDIEIGKISREDNPLKNAPHPVKAVISDLWDHSYTREKAAFPDSLTENKFWPSVGRINNAYGDRNLVCTCESIIDFSQENNS